MSVSHTPDVVPTNKASMPAAPLTPTQTNEPSSALQSLTPGLDSDSTTVSGTARRRSLRLASKSGDEATGLHSTVNGSRVSGVGNRNEESCTNGPGSGGNRQSFDLGSSGLKPLAVNVVSSECRILNLRSGKRIPKRGMDLNLNDDLGNGSCSSSSKTRKGKAKGTVESLSTSADSVELEFELNSTVQADVSDELIDVRKDKRGKRKLDEEVPSNVGRRRFSREEKAKAIAVDDREAELAIGSQMKNLGNMGNSDVNGGADNVDLQNQQRSVNAKERASGLRKNGYMERFRDIAKENASRFAHFAEDDEDNVSSPVAQVENEVEDWPGPFSTAMKIIKDRETRSNQMDNLSAEKSSAPPITWVPKRNQGDNGVRISAPSLQQMCLNILSNNAEAIVSLDSVPDALRNKLSQLLCDSRKMSSHFFELLVSGSPTEIRLRDCSWLTEEQFTKSFEMCDTKNLVVLQLDHCGRCMPDCVLLATLAQSPGRLPRLTSLSLRGACRLSDVGLCALVSSAPVLRSINLSQCSLLTSASLYVLADSLGSLLKELYLDECQSIDVALIVPALVQLEHLEVLSVAGIETVSDEFIKNYIMTRGHNIKELVLRDCVKLTDQSLKVIAGNCPGLCALDLVNLCKLTDSSIKYLANGCRELHILKLRRNSFSDEAIAAFMETSGESLRELSLNNVKKVGNHTALSLARHAKALHTLDLSWCRNLADDAVGLIVDSCLALRLLILFGCTQITDVLLNGHSNPKIQIVGMKMSPVLQHVKVPDPQEAALHYSSVLLYNFDL